MTESKNDASRNLEKFHLQWTMPASWHMRRALSALRQPKGEATIPLLAALQLHTIGKAETLWKYIPFKVALVLSFVATGGILKNQNRGLAGRKIWVFTVHPATACPFLSYCQNIRIPCSEQ